MAALTSYHSSDSYTRNGNAYEEGTTWCTICKYVDQKGSASMLVTKRSAGVAAEVNLRNPLHTGNDAYKWRIHPGFENQGTYHQKSKTGVSMTPLKGLMSSKNCLKQKRRNHV